MIRGICVVCLFVSYVSFVSFSLRFRLIPEGFRAAVVRSTVIHSVCKNDFACADEDEEEGEEGEEEEGGGMGMVEAGGAG